MENHPNDMTAMPLPLFTGEETAAAFGVCFYRSKTAPQAAPGDRQEHATFEEFAESVIARRKNSVSEPPFAAALEQALHGQEENPFKDGWLFGALTTDGGRRKGDIDRPRAWLSLDLDGVAEDEKTALLDALRGVRCFAYPTANDRMPCKGGRRCLRVVIALSRALPAADWETAARGLYCRLLDARPEWGGGVLDPAMMRCNQQMYTPARAYIPQVWRNFGGKPLDAGALLAEGARRQQPGRAAIDPAEDLLASAQQAPDGERVRFEGCGSWAEVNARVLGALASRGLLTGAEDGAKHGVRCPLQHLHSSDNGDMETVFLEGEPGRPAVFHCAHQSHGGIGELRPKDIMKAYGFFDLGSFAAAVDRLRRQERYALTPPPGFDCAPPEDYGAPEPPQVFETMRQLLDGGLIEANARAAANGIATGLPWLDRITKGGLSRGRLYVLGAQAGIGKSALALQIADRAAARGRKALLFSFEMGAYEHLLRSLARLSCEGGGQRISIDEIQDAFGAGGEEWKRDARLAAAVNAYAGAGGIAGNLVIDEGCEPSIERVFVRAKQFAEMCGEDDYPLVVVDYLQLLRPGKDDAASPYEAMKRASRRLKQLSNYAPVLVISSINRAAYKLKAEMDAFKECGDIEFNSTQAFILGYRFAAEGVDERAKADNAKIRAEADAKAEETGRKALRLTVVKNRLGGTGKYCDLTLESAYGRFTEDARARDRDFS